MQPLLKWVGGKRWLAPYLKMAYHNYWDCRLVEPFAGGLSVALKLWPATALLNDINPHLINLYSQIKTNSFALETSFRNEEDYYYQCRREFNRLIGVGDANTPRAAQLFYYLNKYGFNGLCRFNSDGRFNVPFGDRLSVKHPENFEDYTRVFQKWNFFCGDFSNILTLPGDFLYIDPPYDDTFTQYSKEGFDWGDQVRLVKWFAKHDGPLIVSNSWTDRIAELYESAGLKISKVQAPRSISRNADGRGQVPEILATRGVDVSVDQGVLNELFSPRE